MENKKKAIKTSNKKEYANFKRRMKSANKLKFKRMHTPSDGKEANSTVVIVS